MQLAILTAVLSAIAAAESGGGPVSGIAWRLLVVGAAMLVTPLVALAGSQRLAGSLSVQGESIEAHQSAGRLQSTLICLWLAMVAAILVVGQWPRIVQSNWHLAGWPLLDELAILIPVLLPLVFIWAAQYRVDQAAIVAIFRQRQLAPPRSRLAAHLWMQARHQLGLVLVPPLLIVGVVESLELIGMSPTNLKTSWWLAIPLVATVLFCMPIAVRRVWRTSPLPAGPLRASLDAICTGRKCLVREILLWNTDRTMANAAVVGFTPRLRYVLLTDALMARLSERQIAAVLRHELGHLRRWHLPLRLALLLVPVVAWMAIDYHWPHFADMLRDRTASLGLHPQLFTSLFLPLGMLVYALAVVGWYSRLLEHDADFDACLDDAHQFDRDLAIDFSSALERLTIGSSESRLAQWLHPSVKTRLAFIDDGAQNPSAIIAFRRRLTFLAAAICLFYLAAAISAVL